MGARRRRQPAVIAFGLAIALLGCGRIGFDPRADASVSVPPPADYVNGARLRAIRWVSEGVDKLSGWFDTVLGVECELSSTPNGGWRCLPTMHVDSYADPACTVPLASIASELVTSCGEGVGYATNFLTGEVYATTTEFTGQAYALSPSTGCAPVASGSIAVTRYEVMGPVDPAILVSAIEVESAPVGTLSYIELVADDGARQLLTTVLDHARGTRCDWLDYLMDVRYCVGPDVTGAATTVYADAACGVPAVVLDQTATQEIVRLWEPTLCSEGVKFVERGPAHAGPLYQRAAGGCVSYALPANSVAYLQGADVTTTVPSALPVIASGTTRIRSLRWRTPAGLELPDPYHFWDAVAQAPCLPLVDDTSQSTRCAPEPGTVPTMIYPDAACLGAPINVISECRTRAASVPFPVAGTTVTCTGFTQDIRLYGDDPGLATAYERTPAGCQQIDQGQHPLRKLSPAGSFVASEWPLVTRER